MNLYQRWRRRQHQCTERAVSADVLFAKNAKKQNRERRSREKNCTRKSKWLNIDWTVNALDITGKVEEWFAANMHFCYVSRLLLFYFLPVRVCVGVDVGVCVLVIVVVVLSLSFAMNLDTKCIRFILFTSTTSAQVYLSPSTGTMLCVFVHKMCNHRWNDKI